LQRQTEQLFGLLDKLAHVACPDNIGCVHTVLT
jgi:hypothetical protein